MLFAVLAALCFSIFQYSCFGVNQFDTLPVIQRMADPGYLSNDLFTNSSAQFSEDYYFAKIILTLSKVISMPYVLFILTILTNVGMAIITLLAARHLFGNNGWIGIIAVALLLTMDTMKLGYSGMVVRSDLIPSQLARPFILMALYFALRQRVILVGLISAIATFLHPLEGPGTGLMALTSLAVVSIMQHKKLTKDLGKIALAMLPVFVALLFFLVPYFGQDSAGISDELFFEINIFRFEHHYIPSSFLNIRELVFALGFIGSAIWGFRYWQKHYYNSKQLSFLRTFTILLLLICLGGYVFVEVWPVKIWFIAQAWRFLIYFKWFGILFIAATIWQAIHLHKWRGIITWISAIQPVLLLINLFIDRWFKGKYVFLIQLILVAITVLFFKNQIRSIYFLLSLFALLGMLLFTNQSKLQYLGWSIVAIYAIVINTTGIDTNNRYTRFIGLNNAFSIPISIEAQRQQFREIASALREHTLEDAVILCPAIMSELRLTAERALITDFAGIPMEDKGMEEWYKRIKAFHKPLKPEPRIILDYDLRNIHLDEINLKNASRLYGFDYAILQNNFETALRPIYQSDSYKLVELVER